MAKMLLIKANMLLMYFNICQYVVYVVCFHHYNYDTCLFLLRLIIPH